MAADPPIDLGTRWGASGSLPGTLPEARASAASADANALDRPPARAELFKSRAEALCQAQAGQGSGPPPRQ